MDDFINHPPKSLDKIPPNHFEIKFYPLRNIKKMA